MGGKKFKPTKNIGSDLDKLVKTGVTKEVNVTPKPKTVERSTNGYSLRKDYIEKVALIATVEKKKKYEMVEEGLEMLFEKYKDVLDKFS